LESPETGIIDSHHYMNFLANRITQLNGKLSFLFSILSDIQRQHFDCFIFLLLGDLVCHTRVAAIEQCGDSDRGYIIQTQGNGECVFLAKSVVNSAGLYADKVLSLFASLSVLLIDIHCVCVSKRIVTLFMICTV
jgi:L-2-hydroxyglutarate oxidase LhgO